MKPGLHGIYTALLFMLTGCISQPEKAGVAIPFDAASQDTPSHRIDTASSSARILVYRAGLISSLGHNHIVLTRDIRGELWLQAETDDSKFHLVLPVNSFIVDPADLRAQGGADFSSVPSSADIAGTRRNMLGEKILNAARYPDIEIWSERIHGSGGSNRSADIIVAARGTLSRITMPMEIKIEKEKITATGKFILKQTDIGIAPFSVLMGTLAIRDELEIEYFLTASPIRSASNF
ncbi:MAG TPA: YceI family protein [Gammaproteobacteria bacterium]